MVIVALAACGPSTARSQRAPAGVEARVASSSELEQQLAAVRSSPEAPDLDATVADARAVCERQRGQLLREDASLQCRVGGAVVFTCDLAGGRVERVDTYFEGQSVAVARAHLELKLGPAESEVVSPEGASVFSWDNDTLALARYARGVRVTRTKPLRQRD